MKKETKKIIKKEEAIGLSVLEELITHTPQELKNDHENHPKYTDYGLESYGQFSRIVHGLQEDDNLIQGADIDDLPSGCGVIFWEKARVTEKGKQKLRDNTKFMRTYRGIKNFMSWIEPFI